MQRYRVVSEGRGVGGRAGCRARMSGPGCWPMSRRRSGLVAGVRRGGRRRSGASVGACAGSGAGRSGGDAGRRRGGDRRSGGAAGPAGPVRAGGVAGDLRGGSWTASTPPLLDAGEAGAGGGAGTGLAAARPRPAGRCRPCVCAGRVQPGLVIDLDATLVTCHSEKEGSAATYKHGLRLSPDAGLAGQHRRGVGRDAAAGERGRERRRRPHPA